MNSKYEWVPKEGIGPIKFGTLIQEYVNAGILSRGRSLESLDDSDTYYDGDHGIAVFADDGFPDGRVLGVVDAIRCDKSIRYKDQELLGVTIEDVVKLLGREPDQFGEELEVIDEIQILAEFDGLGLILWFVDRMSVAASIDDGDYEDDEPS